MDQSSRGLFQRDRTGLGMVIRNQSTALKEAVAHWLLESITTLVL
jgi:hypothetical protein